jgi:chaperonin GroEL (HSP60 family)
MTKVFMKDEKLQEALYAGINKLADVVASTLGPKGTNVILKAKGRNPVLTRMG